MFFSFLNLIRSLAKTSRTTCETRSPSARSIAIGVFAATLSHFCFIFIFHLKHDVWGRITKVYETRISILKSLDWINLSLKT